MLVSIALLAFLVNILTESKSFYASQFERLGDSSNLHHAVAEDVREFFKGDAAANISFFNERENRHMDDVKQMIRTVVLVGAWCFVLGLAILFILAKDGWSRTLFVQVSGIIGIGMVILLLILSVLVVSFSSSFDSFHELFFKQGSYQFNPDTEIIITVFPPEFFFLALERIAEVLLGSACLLLLVSFLLQKNVAHGE